MKERERLNKIGEIGGNIYSKFIKDLSTVYELLFERSNISSSEGLFASK